MPASASQPILAAVARFLLEGDSLAALRAATIPLVYDIGATDNPAIQDLADELILRFAENDNGDWDERDLRDELRDYVTEEWPELYASLATAGDSATHLKLGAGAGTSSPTFSQTIAFTMRQFTQRLGLLPAPESTEISEVATFGRPVVQHHRVLSPRLAARFLTAHG